MPIRRSPNGARYRPPQPGRDQSEWVVAINRNAWSQSIGISGRNQSVRALQPGERFRFYSGDLRKDLERAREEGGVYVEMLEAISLTARNLVSEGRIRVEEVGRYIETTTPSSVRVTDYFAIGRHRPDE